MRILKDGKVFEGNRRLAVSKIEQLLASGLWTEEDLKTHGLECCTDTFVVPDGMKKVGEPTYTKVDGQWKEEYSVEKRVAQPVERITFYQFLLALIDYKKITLAQAIKATKGTMPKVINDAVSNHLVPRERLRASLEWNKGYPIKMTSALVQIIKEPLELTTQDLRDIFSKYVQGLSNEKEEL